MSLKPSVTRVKGHLSQAAAVEHALKAGMLDKGNAGNGAPDNGDADKDGKDNSMLTVLIAVGANFLIAIAKTVVAFMTGSASMIAEAAHSWADTGNGTLLIVAEKKSVKPADTSHPLGYGKESYVWSMIAAFGVFTAGAIVWSERLLVSSDAKKDRRKRGHRGPADPCRKHTRRSGCAPPLPRGTRPSL